MKRILIELLKSESCPKCKAVKEIVFEAIKDMNIVELGIVSAPVIVINGKVKFSGIIPKKEDILRAINEECSTL